MIHWLLFWTGGLDGSSRQYLELSGFLSIILPPLFTVLGIWAVAWYHSRCHVAGCLKHGRYPFHHFKLCQRHHPKMPQGAIDHWHIIKIHKQEQKDGKG